MDRPKASKRLPKRVVNLSPPETGYRGIKVLVGAMPRFSLPNT